MKKKSKKKGKKGFTLIELLVVIAIIGLLSTLAMVAMGNARQKARDAKRLSDIKQIQTALELYFNDKNGYPVNATPGVTLGGASAKCLDDSAATGFVATCGSGTKYMATVPAFPTPVDGTNCLAFYTYTADTSGTYNIKYCIGSDTGGVLGNTIHKATPAGLVND